MSEKRVLTTILAVVIVAASAAAQNEKNEVGGIIGRTFISDQGIRGATFFNPFVRSGKGTSVELNYARRLFDMPLFAVSGEIPIMFNPDEDLNSGSNVVPVGYKQFFVTPAARLNLFPYTSVSPWVSIGAGFAHFSETSTLVYGGANPGKSTTSAVFQGGIGLDVKIWYRLYIRGEGRDFWSGEPDFPLAATGKTRQHNIFAGGGVFWRF